MKKDPYKFVLHLAMLLGFMSCWVTAEVYAQQEGIEEITITAPQVGPPLWKIKQGENTLWIFADINPVPEKLQWDSSRISRIMQTTNEYLESPNVTTNLGLTGWFSLLKLTELQAQGYALQGSVELKDVIPAALDARIHALVPNKLYKGIINTKPWFAAERLKQYFNSQAGLEDSRKSVLKTLDQIRRRAKVKATASETKVSGKSAILSLSEELSKLPNTYGLACLEATVGILENFNQVKELSNDWYNGNKSVLKLPYWERVCTDEQFSTLQGFKVTGLQARDIMIANLDRALAENKVSFAVVPVEFLLDRNEKSALMQSSALDLFISKGYEVITP